MASSHTYVCFCLHEKALTEEIHKGNALRKQLKQIDLAAEDTIWDLHEKNAELRSKLKEAQTRLVEVETFLSSDRGAVLLSLEEDLAASKLRVAELEAEKDSIEIGVMHRRRSAVSNSNMVNVFKNMPKSIN